MTTPSHQSATQLAPAQTPELLWPPLPHSIALLGGVFSPNQQLAVKSMAAQVYASLSLGNVSLATEVVHSYPGLLLEESFEDSVIQYSLVPPEGYKRPLLERLSAILEPGTANVMDGGMVINICPLPNDKLRVSSAFAQRFGLCDQYVAKFGDCTGQFGNDRHVRGRSAYNVGFDAPADHGVITTLDKGPGGFLEGLHDLEKKGIEAEAIATDLDRTLTNGDGVIDPRPMRAIVDFLESSGRVLMLTGRGLSAVRICSAAFRETPCSVLGLAHFELVLFNGGARARFC